MYDSSGNPLEKGTLKSGNGTIISYNEDNIIIEIINVKNGIIIKKDK